MAGLTPTIVNSGPPSIFGASDAALTCPCLVLSNSADPGIGLLCVWEVEHRSPPQARSQCGYMTSLPFPLDWADFAAHLVYFPLAEVSCQVCRERTCFAYPFV